MNDEQQAWRRQGVGASMVADLVTELRLMAMATIFEHDLSDLLHEAAEEIERLHRDNLDLIDQLENQT